MDTVSQPCDSVLYGKKPCLDRDGRLQFPKGMESFVIDVPHLQQFPVVIPVQLAVNWPSNLIDELQNQQMAESDFLLVTAPKTGTHWMWETMAMLARGQATYSEDPKHHFWLEYKRFPEILAKKDAPRVLNTHRTISQLPPGFRKPSTKIVVCMRNPKDVLVSLYYHFRNVVPRVNGTQFMAFDDMFDLLLYSKYIPFGRTLDHYADTWDNHRDDPNVLIVFYEDVKEKTEEMVRRVADHMGIQYTNKLVTEVTSAIDIKAMKPGKHSSEKVFRSRYGKDASLYRKGEIGDWKNHFSEEQNRKFDKIFKSWNRKRAIPFRFEPSATSQI